MTSRLPGRSGSPPRSAKSLSMVVRSRLLSWPVGDREGGERGVTTDRSKSTTPRDTTGGRGGVIDRPRIVA
jgi:hypothetical protein